MWAGQAAAPAKEHGSRYVWCHTYPLSRDAEPHLAPHSM